MKVLERRDKAREQARQRPVLSGRAAKGAGRTEIGMGPGAKPQRPRGKGRGSCGIRVFTRASLQHVATRHLHSSNTGWALSSGLEARGPFSLLN